MAILTPEQMDFSQDNIIMILTGLPGVGKTTLACSAKDVVIVDIDNGMKRVRQEHRKTAVIVKSYEELLEDLKSPIIKQAKTLVIDTGGALVELMKDWAVTQPNGSKKGGGISQSGYGIVKSEFSRLFRELRANHNCILIFHTLKDKDKDGNMVFDIQCEGATKQTVWQAADLGAYMQIINNERYLCFTPTQEYSAKSSFGIKGMKKIAELQDNDMNTVIESLFAEAKSNIAKDKEANDAKRVEYQKVMERGRAIINSVVNPESALSASDEIKSLPSVLTSKDELKHIFKMHLKEAGLIWNKERRVYDQVPDDTKSS